MTSSVTLVSVVLRNVYFYIMMFHCMHQYFFYCEGSLCNVKNNKRLCTYPLITIFLNRFWKKNQLKHNAEHLAWLYSKILHYILPELSRCLGAVGKSIFSKSWFALLLGRTLRIIFSFLCSLFFSVLQSYIQLLFIDCLSVVFFLI